MKKIIIAVVVVAVCFLLIEHFSVHNSMNSKETHTVKATIKYDSSSTK
jgi:uncharacterized protein YxeA